jgi:pimeloyl-ACP methyl ester carboxylesterase
MARFLDALGIEKFALYVFDYGAPVGFRIAMGAPQRVGALISQNGNAYAEALSDQWGAWQAYWREPSPANRERCRSSLSETTIREFQYLHGTERDYVSPDGYTLDVAYLSRPEADEIQLDLILDYRTNLALYPQFQAYFRERQPPFLAVWGRNDASFLPVGAELYARDIRDAEVHLIDTGHFALETHADEIADLVMDFLDRRFE